MSLLKVLGTCAVAGTMALWVSCTPPAKKIVFAVDPHWPPMEFVGTSNGLEGYDIDLVNAVAQQAGMAIEFRQVPWDGLFSGLAAGQFDVVASSVWINDERKAKYDFSDPYLNGGQVLVVPRGGPVHRWEDLKGKPVAAQLGTPGAGVVTAASKPGPVLKAVPSLSQAFEDLAAGRVAAVVTDGPEAAQYALRDRRFKDLFQVVGPPMTQEKFGLVVAKGRTDLLNTLNAALGRLKAAGTLDDLAARWLH